MKISIIIPTYNHCEDLLKPLCESIIKHTDLANIEIIIVANGCIDNTREYVESLGSPFKLLWIDEASGYTKSTNEGIKASTGEFVILLNNDCVVLDQNPKGVWIDILLEWFLKDERVGITGPMKTFCPEAKRDFLIFFCVMIRKSLFTEIGLLDEVFSPGYGEDTDFCAKLENAGYKIVQVLPTQEYYGPNQMKGTFPIYHQGNVTFKNWPWGEELLKRNNETLRQRYVIGQPDIEKAKKCDGFMNEQELRWLGREAMNRGKCG
jgi:GT2 family glycosyltransferase